MKFNHEIPGTVRYSFSIALLLLLFIITPTIAQEKKDQKAQYTKYIAVDPGDYNNFIEALNQWQRLSMFDPNASAEAKVSVYQNLESYKSAVVKRARMDSLLIPTAIDSTKAKKSKK